MSHHLIIFTRYPEVGKAKTRLIPAIGAEGAAALHRRLTEHTMNTVRSLHHVTIEVQFVGGTPAQMQAWLGDDVIIRSQSEGDLGDRMMSAFRSALERDRAVVIIGTDCPSLTSDLLAIAFQQLKTHDVVLGPAVDGGYYLIGLKRLFSELFTDIPWSTETVFERTIEAADRLSLSVALLPTLNDIDRPEDLQHLTLAI